MLKIVIKRAFQMLNNGYKRLPFKISLETLRRGGPGESRGYQEQRGGRRARRRESWWRWGWR